MKKFFLSIMSVALAISVCLLGSGCGETALTFNNNFSGTDQAPTYLEEVLKYDIKYVDDFSNGYIKKSVNLTDDIVFCDYSGTSVHSFSIEGLLPTYIETNIDVASNRIYHLVTETTINATYRLNGEAQAQTHQDYIKQEIFFLPAGLSFAPIYSYVEQENTLVNYDKSSNTTSLTRCRYEVKTSYDKDSYTVDKTLILNTAKPDTKTQSKQTYEYDFRGVIDNSQFIFASRNLSLSQGSSTTLPVVSFSYGYPVEVAIGNEEELTLNNLSINYNGTALTENVQLQGLRYMVSSMTNSGSSQFIYVQKQGSETLPYRALPVQLVQTLTTHGVFEMLGALVFTLTDVEIN